MKEPNNTEKTVIIQDPTLRQFAGGFTSIPNRILRCSTLSMNARMTYAMLLSYAWQDDFCWPAQLKLAADLGATDRSVRNWLTELRIFGLITWKQLGLNRPNRYYILKLPSLPEDRKSLKNQGPEYYSAPDRNERAVQDRKQRSDYKYSKKKTQHTQSVSSEKEGEGAQTLVGLFHRLCGHPERRKPLARELDQAAQLVAAHGYEAAQSIVRFAVKEGQATNFRMQHFGAILSYEGEALADLDRERRHQACQKRLERERQEEEARVEAQYQAFAALPIEQRVQQELARWIDVQTAIGKPPTADQIDEREAHYLAEEEARDALKSTVS